MEMGCFIRKKKFGYRNLCNKSQQQVHQNSNLELGNMIIYFIGNVV